MPKVSKGTATHVVDHGPVEDRSDDVDGYTVNFITFKIEPRSTWELHVAPCEGGGTAVAMRLDRCAKRRDFRACAGRAEPGSSRALTGGLGDVCQLSEVSLRATPARTRPGGRALGTISL